MGGWISDLISGLIDSVLNRLTSATQATLNWVLGLLSGTVFSSPDVTVLPQVGYMSGRAQLVANACMVLVVTVVGFLAMTHSGEKDRYQLKDLLPRMVVGFAAANMATPIIRVMIIGGNAVTDALAGGSVSSQDSFAQIKRIILGATTDPAYFVVAAVMQLLVTWMLIMLVITWLGRAAVLLVAAATAPLALMGHALPQTDLLARVWWRSVLSCLAIQILQAVTLRMAVATLLSSATTLPALGLPHDPTGLVNLLIACLLLWLVIRIPKWVARTFGGPPPRGGSFLGSIVRVLVVQQLLGAVGLRGGGRLLGRRAARGGTPRPPATHLHGHNHGHQHLHQHLHMHPPRPNPGPGGDQRRPPFHAGQATTPRSHPGRPPQALEARPTTPAPPPRRAIGPR
jgi:hypothetical protein